jgi:hypothetical protein
MSTPFSAGILQVLSPIAIALSVGGLSILGASTAWAQTAPTSPSTSSSSTSSTPLLLQGWTFAATDLDNTDITAQPDAPAAPQSSTKHGGIGIGIKGGPMFATLDTTGSTTFQMKTGYQIGLFIGGNRPGVFGVGTEITYIKRNAQAQGQTTTSGSATALEIPLLFRLNAGSSSLSGADLYVLFGPAIDINLTKFNANFVANTTSYDVNGVVGVGVEITRVILEFRYNRSFKNVAKTLGSSTDINLHSFVLLAGFRFN